MTTNVNLSLYFPGPLHTTDLPKSSYQQVKEEAMTNTP